MGDFVGAHAKPPQSKKKLSALQRSSQARQRMRSIREEATAPGANTPLTLQVPIPSDPSYWAKIVSDNRPIDWGWANGERVGDPGKLSLNGRFPGHRPLSRRLDRCDRVIHNESGDPNGGNMCSLSGATCTSRVRHNEDYVPYAKIRFDL